MHFEKYVKRAFTTAFAVSGKGWDHVNRFDQTSLMAMVTPTDRPKSVRNRIVIEVLVTILCCFLDFFFL